MDKIAWVAGPSKVLHGKTYAKYNVSMRQFESAVTSTIFVAQKSDSYPVVLEKLMSEYKKAFTIKKCKYQIKVV